MQAKRSVASSFAVIYNALGICSCKNIAIYHENLIFVIGFQSVECIMYINREDAPLLIWLLWVVVENVGIKKLKTITPNDSSAGFTFETLKMGHPFFIPSQIAQNMHDNFHQNNKTIIKLQHLKDIRIGIIDSNKTISIEYWMINHRRSCRLEEDKYKTRK